MRLAIQALLFIDVGRQSIRHTTFYGRYWPLTVARLAADGASFPTDVPKRSDVSTPRAVTAAAVA